MGSSLSVVNDSDQRCNIRVYTVGRSFVVGTMNLAPGEKARRKVHKVWYDIVFDFGDMNIEGTRGELHYEAEGVYFAKDQHIQLSEILKKAQQREAAEKADGEALEEEDSEDADESSARPGFSDSASIKTTRSVIHEATKDGGQPLKEHGVAANFPCSPAELFELKFKNAEFRDWQRARSQPNVSGVQESEWTKSNDGRETREMSFIMKLTGAVGPSQTKCLVVEEVEHYDEHQYIAVKGTTRTPDVPYGNSFHTETRTVFTWQPRGCRMSVSFETVWDKSSMLKGVIEKSSSAGQIATNKKLVADLKRWLSERSDQYERRNSASSSGTTSPLVPDSKDEWRNAEEEVEAVDKEPAPVQQQQVGPRLTLTSPLVVYALIATNLATLWLWLRSSSSACNI